MPRDEYVNVAGVHVRALFLRSIVRAERLLLRNEAKYVSIDTRVRITREKEKEA